MDRGGSRSWDWHHKSNASGSQLKEINHSYKKRGEEKDSLD